MAQEKAGSMEGPGRGRQWKSECPEKAKYEEELWRLLEWLHGVHYWPQQEQFQGNNGAEARLELI